MRRAVWRGLDLASGGFLMAEPDVSRRGINRAAPEYAVNSAFGYAPFRIPGSASFGRPLSAALPRAAYVCAGIRLPGIALANWAGNT